jgi:hypothetical protein
VLLHSHERGCFEQSWFSSLMKTWRGRQYSFKEQTEFTMLNKLMDPLASNINDSLTRATVLLPSIWMGWFCKKEMVHPWKHWKVCSIHLNRKLNSQCWTRCYTLLLLTLIIL